MKTPRYTDRHKFKNSPYADAKASSEPGYLAQKFAAIRERMDANEAEQKKKVRDMKKRAA